jgi:hypothetical protein
VSVDRDGYGTRRCSLSLPLPLPLSASKTLTDAKCGWRSTGSARLAAFLIPCHPERACESRGPRLEVNGHCSLVPARLRLPDTVPGPRPPFPVTVSASHAAASENDDAVPGTCRSPSGEGGAVLLQR